MAAQLAIDPDTAWPSVVLDRIVLRIMVMREVVAASTAFTLEGERAATATLLAAALLAVSTALIFSSLILFLSFFVKYYYYDITACLSGR